MFSSLDIVMSADNAIVIALAVRNLPLQQKRLATAVGIRSRCYNATPDFYPSVAIYLLQIPGLKFIGGLMLLVVVREVCSLSHRTTRGRRSRERHPQRCYFRHRAR